MIWNETKRALNLEKHGLDFVDTGLVLSNRYRLEFETVRNEEVRRQTFAYISAHIGCAYGDLVAW